MQTNDYVPGASGLKIDLKTGEIEINSARLQVGSLPSEPQMVTITAGEWPDNEMPSNAIERYKNIGAELAKIPPEFQDSAEFTTKDYSFDCDGSDYRTTLTYQRRETTEEVVARQNKAKIGGSSIKLVGGVITVTHEGVVRCQITGMPDVKTHGCFIVVDGVTYIDQAFVKEARIEARVPAQWTIKKSLLRGKLITTGFDLGPVVEGYTGDVPPKR